MGNYHILSAWTADGGTDGITAFGDREYRFMFSCLSQAVDIPDDYAHFVSYDGLNWTSYAPVFELSDLTSLFRNALEQISEEPELVEPTADKANRSIEETAQIAQEQIRDTVDALEGAADDIDRLTDDGGQFVFFDPDVTSMLDAPLHVLVDKDWTFIAKDYFPEQVRLMRTVKWDERKYRRKMHNRSDILIDEGRKAERPCPGCGAIPIERVIRDRFGVHYYCPECNRQHRHTWDEEAKGDHV